MSTQIAEVKTVIGEEGIRVAVDALKEIAADEPDRLKSEQRIAAAGMLLLYATYFDPQPE